MGPLVKKMSRYFVNTYIWVRGLVVILGWKDYKADSILPNEAVHCDYDLLSRSMMLANLAFICSACKVDYK